MKSLVSTFNAGLIRMPAVAAALGLAALVAAPPTAVQAETGPPRIEVGRSALVVHEVVGKFGETKPTPIKLDDQVLFNEDISTGDQAKTVLRFRDGSTFSMGPNAVVRVDSFVFNPDEGVSHKTVSVTQGVFRYISGFAAKDQEANIKLATGTMSIRGSVVSGVVTPGVPPLLFLAQGAASFANSAGTTDVSAGQGIAVPSATTPPINPASLPPAVIAQALSVIEPLLPSPQVQSSLAQPGPQVLAQQGQLNLVPAAAQAGQQAGVTPTPVTVRPSTGAASLAGALTLLKQADSVGLLNGSQSGQSPTPQQQAFLNQVSQAANQALTQLNQAQTVATTAHDAAATSATIAVAQGLSGAATTQAGPTQTAALTPPPGPPAADRAAGGPGGSPAAGSPGATPGPIATPATGLAPTGGTTLPTTPQAVQTAIASPGANVTPTVISVSEANPTVSEAALRTALNVLGSGTGAAAAMISSFAQDIGDVADCDIDAGKQMAVALQAVLKDPGFSTLGTNNPNAVALAQTTADTVGITTLTPTGTPTPAPTPTTTTAVVSAPPPPTAPPTTFGNFGSTLPTLGINTGAPTSPAT